MDDEAQRIDDLRRDLNDGDDLTTAMALIGDVMQRRLRRVQRSLDELRTAFDPDREPDLDALARRIRSTLDRFEREVGGGQQQLTALVRDFQATLDEDARRLDELHDGDDSVAGLDT